MNGKKLITLGLSAMMSVSLLAGCSSNTPQGTGTSTTEGEEIVLTVWTPSEDQANDSGNWLDKELTAFKEAHPEWNITFKTGVCPEGDALKTIQTDPEAAADVFMFANDQIPDLLTGVHWLVSAAAHWNRSRSRTPRQL